MIFPAVIEIFGSNDLSNRILMMSEDQKICNILVVDDETYNLEAVERALRFQNGYTFQVYKTTSPLQALQMVREEQIHIIISDQRMKEMSGVEMLNQVSRLSPNTVRIILTAYTDRNDLLDAINVGKVYRYLTKPWNAEDLRMVVKDAVDYYALIHRNQTLTEELTRTIEELQESNKELKKLDDLKNRFMVVASHELRTPATIITSSLELLNNSAHQLDPQMKRVLHTALKGAYRLNEVLETLFEIVEANSQKLILNPVVVNLVDLFNLLLGRMAEQLNIRQLNIKMVFEENLMVLGDRHKLYQVFENLISNAIKYTPDGGHISIRGERLNGCIRITVQDTGAGIPSEELQRIFETFYQLENLNYHHSSRYDYLGGGSGLGLSLCKSIIKAHQGKIWAESEGIQKGSTFYVELPAYHADSAGAK